MHSGSCFQIQLKKTSRGDAEDLEARKIFRRHKVARIELEIDSLRNLQLYWLPPFNKRQKIQVKAVLFDLDETILDRSLSLRDFVYWQIQDSLHGEIADHDEFVRRFIELDANGSVWKDQVYKLLLEEFFIKSCTQDELLESYVTKFRNFCRAKPFAIEAITAIRKMGKKIGLVTNGKSPFQEENFKALGISQLFDEVVVSDAVGFKKPQKEIFILVCNRLGIKASEAIFVGDNPIADIEGANSVGMYTIYIPGHFGVRCELANQICANLQDLPALVKNARIKD